jgi:CRISPR-associated protein Cas2
MHLWIVAYDITDDDRRGDVADVLLSWGRRIQYSVFECALGDTGEARLRTQLDALIDHLRDQVLFFDLGPLDGRAATAVTSLGRGYSPPDTSSIVI